ncbi:DUF7511 domain-containing protein [Natrinema versiforme]
MLYCYNMTPTIEGASGRGELNAVVIGNPSSVDECLFYPSVATDEELETMWILAKEGDYTPLKDSQ